MTESVLFAELAANNNKKIAVVTLNAEKSLNALDQTMLDLLYQQLRQWQDDERIACIFLQGQGKKAFCAGGDVRSLRRAVSENKPQDPLSFFEKEYRTDYLIHNCNKPVICWGHGVVMGGGLGLMAGADFRVATDRTLMAMPEISIGLYPDVAGSWLLGRMPPGIGLFMGLTGCRLNAADAMYLGLANRFIDNAFRENVLEALQGASWQGDEQAEVYQVLREYSDNSAGWLPYSKVREHRDLITRLMDQPTLADIMGAIDNLQTEDDWLGAAKKAALNGSPLSAAITYRQLQNARHMSLKEVFQSELILSVNTVLKGDFSEGVRALLVDRDGQPDWQFKSVGQVDSEVLDSLFESTLTVNPLDDLM